jgi:hypothetical protein
VNLLSVQQTTDGGYILAGFTPSINGQNDVYLIKTNASGETIWAKTYGGAGNEGASSVDQTLDGGYIIVGTTDSFGAGSADIYLIKTNTKGDTLWTKTFGGADIDHGRSVQQTSDGGYFILGNSGSKIYLIKTTSTGNIIWTNLYGPSGAGHNAYGNSAQQTIDGGYIITGQIYLGITPDVYLLKVNNSGLVRIDEYLSDNLPKYFELYQNYPNPFNPSTKIRFALHRPSFVILKVYSIWGEEVATLVAENFAAGRHEVKWDASGHASGVYLYRLEAGKFIETKKLALLK